MSDTTTTELERLRELCGELVGALAKCADMLDEIHMMHPDMKWTDSIRATIVARKTIAKAKGGDEWARTNTTVHNAGRE